MKVALAWDFVSWGRLPSGLLVNPKCPCVLMDDSRCGLPATVRVTGHGGLRSTFWCSLHVWPRTSDDAAWKSYQRMFPNALDRRFIDWMALT